MLSLPLLPVVRLHQLPAIMLLELLMSPTLMSAVTQPMLTSAMKSQTQRNRRRMTPRTKISYLFLRRPRDCLPSLLISLAMMNAIQRRI